MILAIPMIKPYIPTPNIDIFLASVFSGVISGLGSGIFFKSGASAGGTDIISMIMKKKRNLSVGTVSFVCNLAVLSLSLILFDLKIALYTSISMWVSGKITDQVIEGLNRNKAVTIVSEKNIEISERIMKELNRGVTLLEGFGAYSKSEKKVVNCVVSHFEIVKLKELVFEVDPNAFMFFTETTEVSGKDFTRG